MSHSSTDSTPLLSRGLDSPERPPPTTLPTTPTRTSATLRPPTTTANKLITRIPASSSPHPERPHIEAHMGAYDAILRDVIIGFSDGLTVPFALTAGLSSLGDSRIVIMGGLAELASGMLSMGLGAWLAADTERQHWEAELARETTEVETTPAMERAEIFDILASYGISRGAAEPLVDELAADKDQWVRFMMDFELRLPEPDAGRAWVSAATMGLSYFVGGLIPMVPYFFLEKTQEALMVSVVITVVVLVVFGFLKNWVAIRTRKAGFWGAAQTLFVGALAAGLSYAIVKALDRGD